jgi:adenylate kinase
LLERGELAPDRLVVAVVDEALAHADRSYILEGFPRTVSQAREAEARQGARFADAVVFLHVPDDVARRRLAGRTSDGRVDDRDPDVIERRLRRFHADTEPLVDYYRGRNLLVTVDATPPPPAVTRAVLAALAATTQS